MTTIYGLSDPRTGELRYVGKTTMTLRRRLNAHVGHCTPPTDARERWLAELLAAGLRPECFCIEEVEGDGREEEEHYIASLRLAGCDLFNVNKGARLPMSARAAISVRHSLRRHSPETRAKISAANARRETDWAQIERLRAMNIGRPLSQEHRQALSRASKGKAKPAEHRAAIKAALTARYAELHQRVRDVAARNPRLAWYLIAKLAECSPATVRRVLKP